MLVVRNGLIVTWAWYYPPDICMVYYHTRDTQPSIQLKEGLLATTTILLCSRRKRIRLVKNPHFKFWIITSLSAKHGFCPWCKEFSNIPHGAFLPGHSMAGILQWIDASTNTGKEPKARKWPDGRGSGIGGPEVYPRRTRSALTVTEKPTRFRLSQHNSRPLCTVYFWIHSPSCASWHHFSECNMMSSECCSFHSLNPSLRELASILIPRELCWDWIGMTVLEEGLGPVEFFCMRACGGSEWPLDIGKG